ncbi:MAG: sugar phosphate isomerase/epimerase [Acidobacteriia bacterium]|nr:sugar phosphate isomerase/epimerase [Terriglobia bacterium]
MPIRIATAPVSWGVMEVEGWSGRKGYGEVLDEMAQAGYAGTELGPYGFLPSDPAELERELESRGLALLGAFVPLPLARPERHQQSLLEAMLVARLLADRGAPFLVLADEMNEGRMAVAGSAQTGMNDAQWNCAVDLLNRASAAAREMGLRPVFHHHAGTYVETPAEVERLLHSTGIDLCLDTGHYYYGGGDPVACAHVHAGRIGHLHLKDVRPDVLAEVRRRKIPYLEAVRRGVFCELGEGGVDIPGVVRELEAAGFDGWGVFEQDVDPTQPGVNPVESALRSREYLRGIGL